MDGVATASYDVVSNWAKLPPGWTFNEVTAIAVDCSDNVYVASRSDHPITVFNKHGEFIKSWGEGRFPRPHGLHFGHDGFLYVTDDGLHSVCKCTTDGNIVLEIRGREQPQP